MSVYAQSQGRATGRKVLSLGASPGSQWGSEDEVMMSTQPWDRVALSRKTVRRAARAMDLSVPGAKPRWVEVGVVAEKPP